MLTRLLPALLALFPTIFATTPSVPGQTAQGVTARFGEWKVRSQILKAKDFPLDIVFQADGAPAGSVRLQFGRSGSPSGRAWTLLIHDGAGHLVSSFDSRAFDGAATFWTGPIRGETVTLDLAGGDATTEVELRGALAMPSFAAATAFSVVAGGSPWEELYPTSSAMLRAVGSRTGILLTAGDELDPGAATPTRLSWCCSGVMIAPDVFLTNWHCGGAKPSETGFNAEVIGNAVVDLAWEDGPARRFLAVKKRLLSDERLDFALLQVTPANDQAAAFGRPVPVRLSQVEVKQGDPLVMVHHAQCRPKLVSRNCSVRALSSPPWTSAGAQTDGSASEIGHDCASEAGASGAGMFDPDGWLVALHHLGFVSDPQRTVGLNSAVRMSAIAAAVRKQDRALADRLGW